MDLPTSPRPPATAAPLLPTPCSGEDSGELAALATLQKRRQSMHGAGGTHRQQRYGSYWQGDDRELESTLHVGAARP